MAKLSNASYVERGYAQVEPNHLSAQKNGQIYAQLPAEDSIEVLENGQFVKYDYAANVVDFVGAGEWMLVYNEVKVYDDYEGDSDFAMKRDNHGYIHYSAAADMNDTKAKFANRMVPRVLKTMIGDIFTTNCVNETELAVNDELVVGDDGYLTKTAGEHAGSMKWQVVKVYTLADRQKAVKIMRIA